MCYEIFTCFGYNSFFTPIKYDTLKDDIVTIEHSKKHLDFAVGNSESCERDKERYLNNKSPYTREATLVRIEPFRIVVRPAASEP